MRSLAFLLLASSSPFFFMQEEQKADKPSIDDIGNAAIDIQKVDPQRRETTRYLTLAGLRPEQQKNAIHTFSGWINHLSRANDIVLPVLIPGSRLLRIDLADYEIEVATWEKLAKQDPFFHAKVVKVIERTIQIPAVIPVGYQWFGGEQAGSHLLYKGDALLGEWSTVTKKWRPWGANGFGEAVAKSPISTPGEVKTVTKTGEPVIEGILAPWLSQDDKAKVAIAELIAATKSQVPIVRLDWFIYQTGAAQDRDPGYYDFLGVKDETSFKELAGFSADAAKKAKRLELLEAVAKSGVSQQPRRIASFPTVGGLRLWQTFDSAVAIGEKNPLVVLDTKNYKHDASEFFGGLPNGLWMFLLADKDGKTQKTAPDFIGPDRTSTNNDGRIHVGVSCVRCHYPHSGLQPVDEWARTLFSRSLDLKAVDPTQERELRAQYLRDLKSVLEGDRVVFSSAMKRASGLEPKEYAEAMRTFWWDFETNVGVGRAALDLDTTPEEFRRRIKEMKPINPLFGAFLLEGERERPIPLQSWWDVYAESKLMMMGTAPKKGEEK